MSWSGQIPCHPVEVAGCVYVEVPKAGCTSVKWALSPLKGGPPSDDDIHPWFGYTHARGVEQLYEWLDTRWSELFRFTVVRDPIARFCSFYYGLQPHERGAYGDINRYVLDELDRDEQWRWDIHLIPQTLLLGRELERFDFVGRTEDMLEVGRKLKAHVSPKLQLPHLNRSTATRDVLTADTRRHLKAIYALDYEVLGYDR